MIEPNYYQRIHRWIRSKYGKASRCEGKNCKKISKKFNWAKKRNKIYAKNIKSFFQLCRSCHAKYDLTENTRRKLRLINKGTKKPWAGKYKHKPHSKETKRKIGLMNNRKILMLCRICNKEKRISPSKKRKNNFCSNICRIKFLNTSTKLSKKSQK